MLLVEPPAVDNSGGCAVGFAPITTDCRGTTPPGIVVRREGVDGVAPRVACTGERLSMARCLSWALVVVVVDCPPGFAVIDLFEADLGVAVVEALV